MVIASLQKKYKKLKMSTPPVPFAYIQVIIKKIKNLKKK